MLDIGNEEVCWRAPIAQWAAWSSCEGLSDTPDVSFVEPMLRRRLSSLAKMSLRVAQDCAEGIPSLRFVFSSRHGDLTRTTAMLNDLADDEPLSPTTFSLSVLNASAGLFSILRGDATASTAISAAESSFGFGLLESAAQFAADPGTPVLYVYADEPAPAIYGAEADTTGSGHAVAILLSGESKINLECRMDNDNQSSSNEPHSRAFLRSLSNGNAGMWFGEGRRWAWKTQ